MSLLGAYRFKTTPCDTSSSPTLTVVDCRIFSTFSSNRRRRTVHDRRRTRRRLVRERIPSVRTIGCVRRSWMEDDGRKKMRWTASASTWKRGVSTGPSDRRVAAPPSNATAVPRPSLPSCLPAFLLARVVVFRRRSCRRRNSDVAWTRPARRRNSRGGLRRDGRRTSHPFPSAATSTRDTHSKRAADVSLVEPWDARSCSWAQG